MTADSHAGRVAAIYGASRGMGRASAKALAERGASVAAVARSAEALASLVNEIRAAGGAAEAFPANLEDPAQARTSVHAILERFGRIDILLYAAGTNLRRRTLEETTPQDWDLLERTNVGGMYHVIRAALPALRQSGARVVAISLVVVQLPDKFAGLAYQTTKFAQVGFMHSLMQEEAENGIRTTVIFPGMTDTPLLRLRPASALPPDYLAKALQPEDVAAAVVFVTSLPDRAYVPELPIYPAAIKQR